MLTNVVVFSTPTCSSCVTAKDALAKAGVPYTEIIVPHSTGVLEFFDASGFQTVPQIYASGIYIGGRDDLLTLLATTHGDRAE